MLALLLNQTRELFNITFYRLTTNEIQMDNNLMNFAEVRLTYQPKIKASDRQQLIDSTEAYKLLQQVYDPETIEYRESFKVILLNRHNRVIGVTSIAEGGIDKVSVDVRMIFQAALLANASGIMISHNHPTRNLRPSEEDRKLTRSIYEVGRLINIILLDHIIVTSEGYFSFADEGIL